jgi:hypothetical protein
LVWNDPAAFYLLEFFHNKYGGITASKKSHPKLEKSTENSVCKNVDSENLENNFSAHCLFWVMAFTVS